MWGWEGAESCVYSCRVWYSGSNTRSARRVARVEAGNESSAAVKVSSIVACPGAINRGFSHLKRALVLPFKRCSKMGPVSGSSAKDDIRRTGRSAKGRVGGERLQAKGIYLQHFKVKCLHIVRASRWAVLGLREAKQGEEVRQDMREVKRMGDDDVGYRANYRAIQWSKEVMICGTTGCCESYITFKK